SRPPSARLSRAGSSTAALRAAAFVSAIPLSICFTVCPAPPDTRRGRRGPVVPLPLDTSAPHRAPRLDLNQHGRPCGAVPRTTAASPHHLRRCRHIRLQDLLDPADAARRHRPRLLLGVVARADQRAGLHVPEPQLLLTHPLPLRELLGRDPPHHRRVVRRGPEVLTEREDVHPRLPQIHHRLAALLRPPGRAHGCSRSTVSRLWFRMSSRASITVRNAASSPLKSGISTSTVHPGRAPRHSRIVSAKIAAPPSGRSSRLTLVMTTCSSS